MNKPKASRQRKEFSKDGHINPRIKNQEICVQVRTIQILDNVTLEKCVEELLRMGLKEYWKKKMNQNGGIDR